MATRLRARVTPEDRRTLRERYDPGDMEEWVCQHCAKHRTATRNSVRAAGWRIFDGVTYGGQPHTVRLCKACA
jgi:hypothetical protein